MIADNTLLEGSCFSRGTADLGEDTYNAFDKIVGTVIDLLREAPYNNGNIYRIARRDSRRLGIVCHLNQKRTNKRDRDVTCPFHITATSSDGGKSATVTLACMVHNCIKEPFLTSPAGENVTNVKRQRQRAPKTSHLMLSNSTLMATYEPPAKVAGKQTGMADQLFNMARREGLPLSKNQCYRFIQKQLKDTSEGQQRSQF
jgi:hypothetical protein